MISPKFSLSGSDARGLLHGLLEVNKIQLQEDPRLPSMRRMIEEGKVVYEQQDPDEHWQSYKEIVEQVQRYGVAHADCEDLAPAVAAEDQVRSGIASIPYAYNPRPNLFHVVTAVPSTRFGALSGSFSKWPKPMRAPLLQGYILQDPSARAGMETFGAEVGKDMIKTDALELAEGVLGGPITDPSVQDLAGRLGDVLTGGRGPIDWKSVGRLIAERVSSQMTPAEGYGAIGLEDYDPILPVGSSYLYKMRRSIASVPLPLTEDEEAGYAAGVLLDEGDLDEPSSFGALMRGTDREVLRAKMQRRRQRRRLQKIDEDRSRKTPSMQDIVRYGSTGLLGEGYRRPYPESRVPHLEQDLFGQDLLTEDDMAEVIVDLIESKL